MRRSLALLCTGSIAMLVGSVATAGTPDLSSCDSWQPAASCNFQVSGRPGSAAISYVIIHKVQGSAAGAASWFQNCAAGVSAHYAIDNNNGFCYQCVREKDIAWHCINRNTNGIGIEHGGYVSNNDNSNIMYRKSGLETRSCCVYYGVAFDRAHIQGHSEVPGNDHTDPGGFWDWTFYMSCSDPRTQGLIREKYLDLGGSRWLGGSPTISESTCPDNRGKYNHFQFNNASIYWTPETGAHEIHGDIRQHWAALGWETGPAGYPSTDESVCPDGVGRYNHFKKLNSTGGVMWNASIYWTGGTGAWCVQGAIRDKWASMGWEKSSLGYPTSDEYAVTGGRRSNFQHGTITYNSATGAVTVP